MKIAAYQWPENGVVFRPEGATVDFVTYEENGMKVIGFDSQLCIPPEPMVNAMIALSMLTDANTQVIMVNHRSPVGLLAKIGGNFEMVEALLKNGAVKLTFSYKEGYSHKADLSDSHCAG